MGSTLHGEASIGANDASSNNLKGAGFPGGELQRLTPAARSHSERSSRLCRVAQAHQEARKNFPPRSMDRLPVFARVRRVPRI